MNDNQPTPAEENISFGYTGYGAEDDFQNDPYTEAYRRIHQGEGFTPLPGGINVGDINYVATGLRECNDGERPDFYDSQAHSIHYPRREDDGKAPKECFHEGYARMLWDYVQGNIFQGRNIDGSDDKTLYRRDVDMTGEGKLLDSWHVLDMQKEYVIPKTSWNPMWVEQMLYETGKLTTRVRRGIKFRNVVFVRPGTEYQFDPVGRIEPGNPKFNEPYLVNLDCDFDEKIAAEAQDLLKLITTNDNGHSAENLTRIFATPMLEPYKHLTYIMYGDGGNGKGLIVKSMKETFKEKVASVDAQKILGGQRGGGGFSTDQEVLKLLGAMWAFDEEANDITLEQMTNLKRISTGDPLVARRIQENAIEVQPYAAFTICSNNPVVTTMTAASARRFAFIRMSENKDWAEREKDPNNPMDRETAMMRIRSFIKKHKANGWMMASCALWEQDEANRIRMERDRAAAIRRGDSKLPPHWEDHWTDVVIGSSSDLTRAQEWYISRILEHGYAISRECPYRENDIEHKNSIAMLGLESSTKRIDGVNRRVLIIAKNGKQRFDNYAQQFREDEKTADIMPEIPYREDDEPEGWDIKNPPANPEAGEKRSAYAPVKEEPKVKTKPAKKAESKPRKQRKTTKAAPKPIPVINPNPVTYYDPTKNEDPQVDVSPDDYPPDDYDADTVPQPPAGWDDNIPLPDEEPMSPEYEPPEN